LKQARMAEEIDRLRARGGRLVGQGGLSVYQAHSHEIPTLLPEIGRLREITFREVGEGTGNDIDLDKYDRYYEHLILWDEEKEQVAGAYRLGRADMILREYGPKGLYTNTLFKFEKPFLANLEACCGNGAQLHHQGLSAESGLAAAAVEGDRALDRTQPALQEAVWPGEHQQGLQQPVAEDDRGVFAGQPHAPASPAS
jgi:hypothetical protein